MTDSIFMRFLKSKNNGGFTFFEVVVALVLIGIFTTVAIVQHASTDPSLIVQSQVLKSHIRYAQMRSMNSDVSWGIEYHHSGNPADRFYELYSGAPGNIATLPGETDNRVRLGDLGITIDLVSLSGRAFQLSFDAWGQPRLSGDLVTDPITLSLSKAGQDAEQLIITPHTGFIR